MIDVGRHVPVVDAWLKRTTKNLPAAALLDLFEAALTALWAGARTTLGEITLTAIAERVLCGAAEKYPLFENLKVEPERGIELGEIRQRLASAQDRELKEAFRFVLVEFLTVLGTLTAELLTPELHLELERVTAPRPAMKSGGKRP